MFFSKSHEWIVCDENRDIWLIGITNYAQKSLGKVTYYETNVRVGDIIKAGDVIALVESVKVASDVYSPVSGTIIEVNDESSAAIGINREPQGEGWMIAIKLAGSIQDYKLMGVDEYDAMTAAEC